MACQGRAGGVESGRGALVLALTAMLHLGNRTGGSITTCLLHAIITGCRHSLEEGQLQGEFVLSYLCLLTDRSKTAGIGSGLSLQMRTCVQKSMFYQSEATGATLWGKGTHHLKHMLAVFRRYE